MDDSTAWSNIRVNNVKLLSTSQAHNIQYKCETAFSFP